MAEEKIIIDVEDNDTISTEETAESENIEVVVEQVTDEVQEATDEDTVDEAKQTEEITEELDEMGLLKKESSKLKKEVKELKDKQLRLLAEFDNFRKRTARERIELTQTASKDVVTDLLPILDDFERAIKVKQQNQQEADTEEVNNQGFELIYNKVKSILTNKGLKPMETIGGDFDAELHEAVAEIPAPNEELKDKIIDEVQKGYYLHEKIIRYAKVVIGR